MASGHCSRPDGRLPARAVGGCPADACKRLVTVSRSLAASAVHDRRHRPRPPSPPRPPASADQPPPKPPLAERERLADHGLQFGLLLGGQNAEQLVAELPGGAWPSFPAAPFGPHPASWPAASFCSSVMPSSLASVPVVRARSAPNRICRLDHKLLQPFALMRQQHGVDFLLSRRRDFLALFPHFGEAGSRAPLPTNRGASRSQSPGMRPACLRASFGDFRELADLLIDEVQLLADIFVLQAAPSAPPWPSAKAATAATAVRGRGRQVDRKPRSAQHADRPGRRTTNTATRSTLLIRKSP